MQAEKKYLVDEVGAHLDKSAYFFIADYTRITVAETEQLRKVLAEHGAEFHVVKNSILRIASKDRSLPDLGDQLKGQTALIVGGKNASGVAKALEVFFKEKQKLTVKAGVLGKSALSAADVSSLAKLPPIEVMRAQFLGLLNQPASQFVRVLQAVPQGVLNVLQAKADQGKDNA